MTVSRRQTVGDRFHFCPTDGLFDPLGGHKIGFVRSGLRKVVGHLEPQGRRLPVNKHDVATEISLNRGGEMKLPSVTKKASTRVWRLVK